MKKALVILAVLVSTNAMAYSEDPHQEFDMTSNMTNKTTITFRQVDNINAVCQSENIKRGFGKFPYKVVACSFWNGSSLLGSNECLVITSKTANFHTLGHEVRHCLQGNFHK